MPPLSFEGAKINTYSILGPAECLPLGYVCSLGSEDPSSVCAVEIKVRLGDRAKTLPLVSNLALDRNSDSGKFVS